MPRIRKRYTVEHLICGKWMYYFGSDSRAMAESVGRHLGNDKQPYRILDGKAVILENR